MRRFADRNRHRLAVAFAILGLVHLALAFAVLFSIKVGIGGKTTIAIQGLVLERRATYAGLFVLAGVLLVGAAIAAFPSLRLRVAAGVLVAFGYGTLATHFYHIGADRLEELTETAVDTATAFYQRPPTAYPDAARISTLIDIPNPGALAARRQALVRYIWKADALPDALPTRVERNIPDPTGGRLPGLVRTTALTIGMEHGFAAVAHYFEPANITGAPVLYNHGHVGTHLADDSLKVIAALLAEGRPVVAFTMPNRAPNISPARIETAHSGAIPPAFDHEIYRYLETESFSPLKLFVHPLVVAVNWLETAPDGPHAEAVDAVGFSGGGWTVTVDAAVDPRVRLSIPVAGSLPLYLMVAPPNSRLGDYEQLHPGLLARANFLELYVMGAAGQGRRQVQILNQFDGCCYRGTGARDYAPVVAETVTALGEGGGYDLLITGGDKHEVNSDALARIRDELRKP
jgi:hypothetical protein